MMRLFMISLLCVWSIQLFAQEKPSKRKVGFTFTSLGANDVVRFVTPEGANSYRGDKFYAAGVFYGFQLKKRWEAEIGLEYANHSIYMRANVPPFMAQPEDERRDIYFINIPFTFRANLSEYVFTNMGMLLSIDPSTNNVNNSFLNNQSGFGLMAGLGANYAFDSGISVFVNPYARLYSLIPFVVERGYQDRVLEAAIRFGVAFEFGG